MKRLIMAFTAAVATALSVHTAKADETVGIYDVLLTDSTGFFVTDYVPNLATTLIEMKVGFTETANSGMFTASLMAKKENWSENLSSTLGSARWNDVMSFQIDTSVDYYNNSLGSSTKPEIGLSRAGETHTYAIRGNQITVDGVTTKNAKDAVNKPAAGPLLFLATNFGNGQGNVYTPPRKVYYIRISETDGDTTTLVHEYLPAKNESGAATLYDTVDRVFLTPVNAKSFAVTCEHDWSEWSADTATKFTGGRRMRTCTKCQTVESRQTPQLWDYLKTDSKGFFLTDYVPNLAKTLIEMKVGFTETANAGMFTASLMAKREN